MTTFIPVGFLEYKDALKCLTKLKKRHSILAFNCYIPPLKTSFDIWKIGITWCCAECSEDVDIEIRKLMNDRRFWKGQTFTRLNKVDYDSI